MSENPLRLVSYRRISNERPDGTSLLEQARCIGLRVEADGHQWVADFCDIESGESVERREGFQRALQYIYDGHADGLVVYKIDRYARSVADGVAVLKELHRRRKWLICVRDPIDTSTPMGQAMFQISLVFAELERNTITERLLTGRIARASQLRYAYGRPPAFHEAVKVDGVKMLVATPQYHYIRSIILNMREQGASYRSIAGYLQSCEDTPAPGKRKGGQPPRWNSVTVQSIAEDFNKLAKWVASGREYNYHQPVTEKDIQDIVRMHESGMSHRKISLKKNLGVATIGRILKGQAYNIGAAS